MSLRFLFFKKDCRIKFSGDSQIYSFGRQKYFLVFLHKIFTVKIYIFNVKGRNYAFFHERKI